MTAQRLDGSATLKVIKAELTARVGVLNGASLDDSLEAVIAALPEARPQRFFVEALERLSRND